MNSQKLGIAEFGSCFQLGLRHIFLVNVFEPVKRWEPNFYHPFLRSSLDD